MENNILHNNGFTPGKKTDVFIMLVLFVSAILIKDLIVSFILFSIFEFLKYLFFYYSNEKEKTKNLLLKAVGDFFLLTFIFIIRDTVSISRVAPEITYPLLFISFYMKFFVDKSISSALCITEKSYLFYLLNGVYFYSFLLKTNFVEFKLDSWVGYSICLIVLLDLLFSSFQVLGNKKNSSVRNVVLNIVFIKSYLVSLFLPLDSSFIYFINCNVFFLFFLIFIWKVFRKEDLDFSNVEKKSKHFLLLAYILFIDISILPLGVNGFLVIELVKKLHQFSDVLLSVYVCAHFFVFYYLSSNLKNNIKNKEFEFLNNKQDVMFYISYGSLLIVSYWGFMLQSQGQTLEVIGVIFLLSVHAILFIAHYFSTINDASILSIVIRKRENINELILYLAYKIKEIKSISAVNLNRNKLLMSDLIVFVKPMFWGGSQFIRSSICYMFSINGIILSFSVMLSITLLAHLILAF